MTFILNIVHKEFSLIASDRKATSKGPTRIKMSGITIYAEKGATIHGYKKIHLSKLRNIAVGYAGNTKDHNYIHEIEEIESVNSTLSLIRKHTECFLVQDHKAVLACDSFVEDSGIVTYHEHETDTFFSNIYLFSPIHNYIRQYPGREKGLLIHVGSGSSVFESAMGLEEITQFAESLQSLDDIPPCVKWMKQAYKKVNSIDEGTGEEMVAFLATKKNPFFVDITRS